MNKNHVHLSPSLNMCPHLKPVNKPGMKMKRRQQVEPLKLQQKKGKSQMHDNGRKGTYLWDWK